MGATNLAFQSMANSLGPARHATPAFRSRVMGLYMLVFVGGTPLGAPIIGAVTAHWGARTGMVVCGAAPLLLALVAVAVLAHQQRQPRLAIG